jgi:hypothetical protein
LKRVMLVVRLLLSMTFFVAGTAKLRDGAGTQAAVRNLGIATKPSRPIGKLLPVAELGTAALLLPSATVCAGAAIAITLLVGFSLLLGENLRRGRKPSCGCFGEYGGVVGWPMLLRNAVLTVIALGVVLDVQHRGKR